MCNLARSLLGVVPQFSSESGGVGLLLEEGSSAKGKREINYIRGRFENKKKRQYHYKLQKKDRKFSIASKLEYTLIQSLTIIIGLLFETWCAQFLYHTDGVSTNSSMALYIYFNKIFF